MSTIIWFTGLSGAGKTTLADKVRNKLYEELKITVGLVDGDILRQIYGTVSFSKDGRDKNVLNGATLANLVADESSVVLVTMMSPYELARLKAISFLRSKGHTVLLVFVDCSIEELERRDPKGLYKKFNEGLIKNLNGKDLPYEIPQSPDLILDTSKLDIIQCTKQVMDLINLDLLVNWNNK